MTEPINESKMFALSLLRSDFKSFVIKVFKEVSPANEYLDNWHIDVICHELMNMFEIKQNRLIINIPPRYMKSIICSIAFPAYILGHNPKTSIIVVSYADELASDLALKCKQVIESSWYQEIFPNTKLSKNKKSTNDFGTTKGGGRYATSVGGTLTGRGGDYIIIDDPINPKGTCSDIIRNKTNSWYGSTLYTRLNNKNTGKIIVVMQRLHEDDFTGHLLNIDKSFKHIRIPSIAEEDEIWKVKDRTQNGIITFKRKKGEPLHPKFENLEKLFEGKHTMGEFDFAGQYQQNPIPREGGTIKSHWLSYYDEDELWKKIENGEIRVNCIIQSWDTASKAGKNNDYSACVTLLRDTDGNSYVLDCYRVKLETPYLIKKIAEMHDFAKEKYKHKIIVLIEDHNSGTGIIQHLKEDYDIYPVGIRPEYDKETRLTIVSPQIENGTCRFPDNNPHWWLDFERELLTFPRGRNDDQCDALSQALSYKTLSGGGKILTARVENKYDRYSPRLDLSNYNIL